jgi:hypothetical protein
MPMPAELVLHRRPIEAFAAAGLMGPGKAMQHVHSLGPARVALPQLDRGQHFLEQWNLRELPDQGLWCTAPPALWRWAIR